MLTDTQRGAFIAAARSLERAKTPFRHQGRTERGVDCAGLVVYALKTIGYPLQDKVGYGREPFRQGLRGMCVANFGSPIRKAEMQVADVVLMAFENEPRHVGIVTPYLYGGLALLHSYADVKHVVEHRLDDVWMNRIKEVFRP